MYCYIKTKNKSKKLKLNNYKIISQKVISINKKFIYFI